MFGSRGELGRRRQKVGPRPLAPERWWKSPYETLHSFARRGKCWICPTGIAFSCGPRREREARPGDRQLQCRDGCSMAACLGFVRIRQTLVLNLYRQVPAIGATESRSTAATW